MASSFSSRSLSARIFWLTTTVIFILNSLVMIPGMARQWQACLKNTLTQAELAVMLAPAVTTENFSEAQIHYGLSTVSGTVAISLVDGRKETVLVGDGMPAWRDPEVNFDRISLVRCAWYAWQDVLGFGTPLLKVSATFPLRPNTRIEIIVRQLPIVLMLRCHIMQALLLSIMVAPITGGVVYTAIDWLLVKPMRMMTANMRV